MSLNQVVLSLCLLPISVGCGPGQQKVSGINQSFSSFNSGGEGVPGIDSGTVVRITLKAGPPEGMTFVIWTEQSSSGGHGGTRLGTNAREAYYEGKITGNGGQQVTFRINTTDGVTGVLSFDDEDLRFNTTDGELILVSTEGGTLRALQSDLDLSQLPTDSNKLSEFAKSSETISTFFLQSKPNPHRFAVGGNDETLSEPVAEHNSLTTPSHPE